MNTIPRLKIDYNKEPFKVFLVYGSFTEPSKGQNAIVIRMPNKRMPWSKKIAPAVQRLVKAWADDKKCRAQDFLWGLEGEQTEYVGDRRLWDTKVLARYDWVDGKLIKVD